MKSKKKAAFLGCGIICFVLLIDQILKIRIKTHFFLGEQTPVFNNWFYLHFVENEGMAFGLSFGGDSGKIILSALRIIVVIAIGFYLYTLINKRSEPLKIIVFSLILAGALGNIIDSCFYGLIFTESTYYQVASFTLKNGYAPFLQGKVVDMLYFPIINSRWPQWIPIIGGTELEFFRPVFNIADSAITIGVAMLLIFYKKIFRASSTSTIPNK